MPRLDARNRLETALVESPGYPMMLPSTIDADENTYRSQRSPTAVPDWKLQQAVFISRYLYNMNQGAHRMVEMLRDFVVGNTSFEVKADDPKVQDYIDSFWTHRHNRFDQDIIASYTLALSVDGELILPVQVTPGDPVPLVGYISPLAVKKVVPLAFRPGSASKIIIEAEGSSKKDIEYPVLGRQDIEELKDLMPNAGQPAIIGTFYVSVNSLADSPRGLPDLFALSDDLEQFNRTNWARMRKAEQEGSYVWDVTIQGASETVLDEFEKNMILNPPRPGGWRVHNERVVWDTVQPASGGRDHSEEMRYHRANFAAGFGIPDFFMSGESGSGRMATSELWSTVIATAGSRQREMKIFVRDIVNFAIDWAIIEGALPADIDRKFRVTAPVIGIRDLQRMAGMIKNFLASVLEMYDRKILGEDSVRGMIRALLINLGFELKDEELGAVLSALDLEKEKAEFTAELQQKAAEEAHKRAKDLQASAPKPVITGPAGSAPAVKKPAPKKAPAKK